MTYDIIRYYHTLYGTLYSDIYLQYPGALRIIGVVYIMYCTRV